MIRKTLDKVKDTLRENKTLLLAAAVTGIVFGITLGLISDGMAHNATKPPENLVADTEATESTEAEEVKEALKDRNSMDVIQILFMLIRGTLYSMF